MQVKSLSMKLLNLFLIIFIINVTQCECNAISVRVKNGEINGKVEIFDGKQVNVFLGIPYAEPPIDDLRFKKPLPVKEWTEPIDATKWPSPCLQIKGFLNTSFSEDCLHLNIWSPVISKSSDELKAVLFYIHGGALIIGSANIPMHDSSVLSIKGDVVVVTINYRLGTFGFLYSGTDEAPGNVGLWDQALALEWVYDNIKYFGGDHNRITISGTSAGSWSVGFHILSPITRNLYKNAIMMSASPLNHLDSGEPDSNRQKWLNAAKSIGCNDGGNSFSSKIMNCLRKTSPEVLTELIQNREVEASNGWPIQVVIDGQFLPHRPLDMLKSGEFKKNINLLIGSDEDEGSFMLMKRDPIKYHPFSPQNLTFNEAFDELKRISSELNSKIPINGEDVAKLYFTGLSDNNDYDLLRRTIGIAIGDWYIGCPTIQFAKTLFSSDKKNSNVYQYYYNSKLGEDKLLCTKWMGVCHGNDIWPLFGISFMEYDRHLDREREVSQQMIEFVSDFVKTGHPTPQNGVVWRKYYTINDKIIAPYYEITNELKPITNFGYGLKINECEYLWKTYIDQL